LTSNDQEDNTVIIGTTGDGKATFDMRCVNPSGTSGGNPTTIQLRAYASATDVAYFGNGTEVSTTPVVLYSFSNSSTTLVIADDDVSSGSNETIFTNSELIMLTDSGDYIALERNTLIMALEFDSANNTCLIAGVVFKD
jgi:hypothetical protein